MGELPVCAQQDPPRGLDCAWTRRSLNIFGPRLSDENGGWQQPVLGEALAPVSRRDMWVLRRASRLALCVPELSDPFRDRARRHALDWLHVQLCEGEEGRPHWCHTHRVEDAERAAEEGDYSSDEDDSFFHSGQTTNSEYFCCPCPTVYGRYHSQDAMPCRCADNR